VTVRGNRHPPGKLLVHSTMLSPARWVAGRQVSATLTHSKASAGGMLNVREKLLPVRLAPVAPHLHPYPNPESGEEI